MLDLIKIRKDLHKIPELAFQEVKTTEYLLKKIRKYENLKIHTFDFPGILVEYTSGEGSYLLFRADMDALPITESTGCDFSSRHDGLMHACGHDMHMTILLGLIEHVAKNKPAGNILLLFQPAEETDGGARRILETGVLDKYYIESAYALHVKGDYPVGTIATRPGVFFANTEEMDVIFTGTSAHVAFAEKGKDALAAAVEYYRELNRIILEKFDDQSTILCKFGLIEGGTVRNAVPAKCILRGTFRALNLDDHQLLKTLVQDLAWRLAEQYGLESEVMFKNHYRAVENDQELYEKFQNLVEASLYDFKTASQQMGGEDFGYFVDKYSGLLFLLGVDTGKGIDLHASNFLPDEKAIRVGLDIFKMIIAER